MPPVKPLSAMGGDAGEGGGGGRRN
jgi:hypothetical protein